MDNSESVSADAYGERHLAFPLRDDQGRAVAIVDLSLGEMKQLPSHENREVQRMLRLLQLAHKEITKEMAGEDKTMVLGKLFKDGPIREKTFLWGLRQSETQTSLHSYRD